MKKVFVVLFAIVVISSIAYADYSPRKWDEIRGCGVTEVQIPMNCTYNGDPEIHCHICK